MMQVLYLIVWQKVTGGNVTRFNIMCFSYWSLNACPRVMVNNESFSVEHVLCMLWSSVMYTITTSYISKSIDR